MRVEGLRAYLSTLDRDRLVDLLIEVSRQDRTAARRLRAAVRQADEMAALRSAVERAFAAPGPLDYWQAIRYARSAGEMAGLLASLVGDGRARAACPLLERAITLLADAAVKSSDATALEGVMPRLVASHAEACRKVRPDPAELARWLLALPYTVDLAGYAPALAETGLALYRDEVRARWAADPGDPGTRLAAVQLARLDRDVDALVALVGGDLRSATQYGRLARTLYETGEAEAAISWAERGLRAHPTDPPGAGLRDFLVEAYLQRGGDADAVAMRRDELRARPHLGAYAALRATAGRAGSWPAERPAALRALRRHNPADHVRALLVEEGDPEAAWTAAKTVRDLDGATWDELATHRAGHEPAQAVPILRRRIDEVLAAPGRGAYRDAVRRLVQLREVCARAGLADDFDGYLRALLDRHRRRPAFLAELAEAELVSR